MSESALLKEIWLAVGSSSDCRLFRNNNAVGWVGDARRLRNGDVLIRNARPLHAGLHPGSGDLIGWAGPRFVSFEIKSEKGRLRADQRVWHDAVTAAGGISGIVRSVDDALRLLRGAP